MKKNGVHIFGDNNMAYLKFVNAAVIPLSEGKEALKMDGDPLTQKAIDGKDYKIVPWGSSNDLPQQIITSVEKSHDLSSNLLFNIQLGYGSGVYAVRRKISDTSGGEFKIEYEPVLDNAEINEFFENNNINAWFSECLTDLNYFYNTFSELILTKDRSKIVEINHLESAYSRVTEMTSAGKIENLLYSAKWDDNPEDKDVQVVPLLDHKRPMADLLIRTGRQTDNNGKNADDKGVKYGVPLRFFTPGRPYYSKPYWYSLIQSGWVDFALAIPAFKKAILKNQMTIKYVVYIDADYFDKIFAAEGITDKKGQAARVKKEYENIQNFLSGEEKAGKATIGRMKYSHDGKTALKNIEIVAVENHFKGGEYIEDSEEVSNIIAYGTGVHGSLIGSHGKSGNINGTEARELFIIKQAIMKSYRDQLLQPLYLIKRYNGWPDDIHFTVSNLVLTTLDKNTGSQKIIS